MKRISPENKGRLLMAASALLWGMAGICVRSITWSPLSQIAVRSILSFAVLAVMDGVSMKLTKKNILGALCMTATGALYVTAITMTGAGTAIVLQYIAPILVFLYSVFFRHRKPSLPEIAITALVFAGVVLSFADSLDMTHLLGSVLGLLSGFTFAGQIIIMNGEGSDNGDVLRIACVISAVIFFPFLFFDSGLTFTAKNIVWMLVLGLFQYGLANVLFGRGIKHVDSVEGSLILTLEPVFNPIPVWIFLGERMGTKAIIGAAAVILGVAAYAVYEGRMKHRAGRAESPRA